jgi:hypothetical protein
MTYCRETRVKKNAMRERDMTPSHMLTSVYTAARIRVKAWRSGEVIRDLLGHLLTNVLDSCLTWVVAASARRGIWWAPTPWPTGARSPPPTRPAPSVSSSPRQEIEMAPILFTLPLNRKIGRGRV